MAETQTGAQVKGQYKPLTEADFFTDSGSITRGKDYYRNGYIYDTTLREGTLKALCQGSSGGPYRVKATLVPAGEKTPDRLRDWHCTCPRGGFCKHIVALVLTWIYHPEQFEVRSSLGALLEEKSREELLELIEQMLNRQPELETLVELLAELPTPGTGGSGAASYTPIDASKIRRQVVAAFRGAGDDWGAADDVASELMQLCELGDRYAEAGQWRNAQTVYATIAEEAMEHYEEVDDHDGEIYSAISDCAEGLADCLDAQPGLSGSEKLTAQEREQLIRSLFELWKFDGDYGNFSTDIAEVIGGNVDDKERGTVEAWLRQEMRPGRDFSSNWHNKKVLDFLQKLKEAVNLSPDELLEEYRRAGLYQEMVEKLLELGRTEEALKVIRQNLTQPNEIIRFADQLAKLGGKWVEVAVALVEEKLEIAEKPGKTDPNQYSFRNEPDFYREWLGEKYVMLGLAEKALKTALTRFQASPNARFYYKVREAARMKGQPPETWAKLRPQLTRKLKERQDWRSLVDIYLDEGELKDAIEALPVKEFKPDPWGYPYGGHPGQGASDDHLRVAKAVEKKYPDEAIKLYQHAVEALIGSRQRVNYAEAAQLLVRVKELYEKQGRTGEWQEYIIKLRAANKSLRALKEELDKLKL